MAAIARAAAVRGYAATSPSGAPTSACSALSAPVCGSPSNSRPTGCAASVVRAVAAAMSAGVPLAVGSDWPIVDLDPWASLWAAVHRRAVGVVASAGDEEEEDARGEGPGLSAEEALRASTAGAAFAAGLDAWSGRLVPGLKADFVVLDQSPFGSGGGGGNATLARSRPRVLATYVGGARRYWGGGGGGGAGEGLWKTARPPSADD